MKHCRLMVVSVLLYLLSCGQKTEHETNKIFNEGVALNLESISAQQKGDFKKAVLLNKKSIDKFKEVFKIDSANPVIRSSLGHCYYVDKEFAKAIFWFDQANKVNGDAAMNYRELGLSKISLGKMEAGRNDIDKSFIRDTTREIRTITVQDLTDLGELAFSYGEGYTQQGEAEKGQDYKKLSLGVLMQRNF